MSEPKYYPILFTGEMVRATLDGRKKLTRRVVKPMVGEQSQWLTPEMIDKVPHGEMIGGGWQMHHPLAGTIQACIPIPHNSPYGWIRCPYGQPGDRLWVRETWRTISTGMTSKRVEFRADGAVAEPHFDKEKESWPRWRPSIFLPRWASRITLEITGVRVERVQDISEADAKAEGIVEFEGPLYGLPEWKPEERQPTAREAFLHLFYGLRKRAPKNENPWVWVIEFKRPSTELPDDGRPICERIADLAAALPEDAVAGLPTDGASQLDHYVYGSPKRSQGKDNA